MSVSRRDFSALVVSHNNSPVHIYLLGGFFHGAPDN